MFGAIPKTKIWDRGSILAVFDSTDIDGMGRLGISSREFGYILSLKNVNSLYRGGYLKKFLKYTRAAVRSSEMTEDSRPAGMIKYWLDITFDEKKNGAIVRQIIDDVELSDCVKFAAIVSILTIKPETSDERLMSIIHNQTTPESIEKMPFWRNLLFILPGFETAEDGNTRITQAKEWNRFEFFDRLLNRASFLCHALENETVSEFLTRTGPNYFKPSTPDNEEVLGALYREFPENSVKHQEKIDDAVKDMNAETAARFYRYFTKTPTEFWPLISEQLKIGKMDVEFRYSSAPKGFPQRNNYSFHMTTREAAFIEHELKESKQFEIWDKIKGLGVYGAPLVAQFYRKRGCQAVVDLISYCEKDQNHYSFMYSSLLYSNHQDRDFLNTISNRELIDSFMSVLDEQYADMPIEWALQLNVPISKDSIEHEEDIYDDSESIIF